MYLPGVLGPVAANEIFHCHTQTLVGASWVAGARRLGGWGVQARGWGAPGSVAVVARIGGSVACGDLSS